MNRFVSELKYFAKDKQMVDIYIISEELNQEQNENDMSENQLHTA